MSKLSEMIGVRLTWAETNAVRDMAKTQGITVSKMARQLLVQGLSAPAHVDALRAQRREAKAAARLAMTEHIRSLMANEAESMADGLIEAYEEAVL